MPPATAAASGSGRYRYAESRSAAQGDRVACLRPRASGLQFLAGNLELFAGLVLFTVLLVTALRNSRRQD
jgi:hypothetical protein